MKFIKTYEGYKLNWYNQDDVNNILDIFDIYVGDKFNLELVSTSFQEKIGYDTFRRMEVPENRNGIYILEYCEKYIDYPRKFPKIKIYGNTCEVFYTILIKRKSSISSNAFNRSMIDTKSRLNSLGFITRGHSFTESGGAFSIPQRCKYYLLEISNKREKLT